MIWEDCPECKEEGSVRIYDEDIAKKIRDVTGVTPVPECRVCGYTRKEKDREESWKA